MKESKPSKKWLIYLIFGGFLVEMARFLIKLAGGSKSLKENFKDFINEEKREVNELKNGQESFKKYCQDSCSLFVDYFVPSNCNDYRPKFLRTKSLVIILVAMVAMKVFVTSYLFFIYPNEAQMESQMTAEILKFTNEDRVKDGLEPLNLNSTLNAAALAKAEDMGLNNYFSHYGPDGKKPWEWINRAQYSYVLAGENLGMNFSTAKAVHDALMDSPSHRQNILNEKYTDVGLAVISCTIDGQKTNVLVEMFGKRGEQNLAVDAKASATIAGTTQKAEVPIKSTTTQILGAVKETKQTVKSNDTETAAPVAKETREIDSTTNFTSQAETKLAKLVPQQQAPVADVIPVDNNASIVAGIEKDSEKNINNEVKFVAPVKEKRIGFATSIVKTSKTIYLVTLTLMAAALLVNIFVRFTVQHKPIIIQTMIVILLIAGIATTKWHILESIGGYIKIL